MSGPGVEYRADPRYLPDNSSIRFGTGRDSRLYYDGTDLVLDPDVVGSGSVSVAGGLRVADGNGLVVGHAAQVTTIFGAHELQVLGTGSGDASQLIGRFSADANPPVLAFLKSRSATVGGNSVPLTDDIIGQIIAVAADGGSFNNWAAHINFEADAAWGVGDAPGRIAFYTTADGAAASAERVRIDSAGRVFIGDTANAGMTVGLTINQGANDNEILALKSSDVAHGMTANFETDTFGVFRKNEALAGGLEVIGVKDANGIAGYALQLAGLLGENADATKTAAAYGPVMVAGAVKSGTDFGAVNANGNVFGVRRNFRDATTVFIVDAEGDLFADGGVGSTNMVTLFDGEDDVDIVRGFDLVRAAQGSRGLIRGRFDRFVQTNEARLVELGVLGGPRIGVPDEDRGLINVTRLQQLHNGAIWQLATDLYEVVAALPEATRAALPERLRNKVAALAAGG